MNITRRICSEDKNQQVFAWLSVGFESMVIKFQDRVTVYFQSCSSQWRYIYTNAFVRNAKSLITVNMAWFCSHEKVGQRELSLSLRYFYIIVRPFPRLPSCISCPSPQQTAPTSVSKLQRGKWSHSTSLRGQIMSALGYARHRNSDVQAG